MRSLVKLFIFVFILTSCSSEKSEETILEISTPDILFSAKEDSNRIIIKSNSKWYIQDIPDWLHIDITEGYNDQEITISSDKNNEENNRSVIVTIVAKEKNRELKITQVGKNVDLYISESEINFAAEPNIDTLYFNIVSNDIWNISDIPDWLYIDKFNGENDATIGIVASKNYEDIARGSTLKIKAGSITQELVINQKALDIQLYTKTGDSFYLGFYEESSSQQVQIYSNTKWTVSTNDNWYTVDKTDGLNEDSITITVSENKNNTNRNGEIDIKAGSKFLKIKITQNSNVENTDNPYQINLKDNGPRNGDNLVKKKIEYIDPGNSGANIDWDFRKLKIVDESYKANYFTIYPSNGEYSLWDKVVFSANDIPPQNVIGSIENNNMYTYIIKNNTLQLLGDENPSWLTIYTPFILSNKYPMTYNDSSKEEYSSDNWYSNRKWYATKGYVEINADGYGSIRLPSGSYKNVLRIKYTRTSDRVFYKEGGPTFSKDAKEYSEKYTIYKWYVKGYRYPVLETHQVINTFTGNITTEASIYYPPSDQTNQLTPN